MPAWFVIVVVTLFAAHTALNVGCLFWLWREYHPRPDDGHDLLESHHDTQGAPNEHPRALHHRGR